MMQVTNRFDNVNYLQNSSKKADNIATPPQLHSNREKIGFWKGAGAYLAGGITLNAIDKSYKTTIGKVLVKNLTNIQPDADIKIDKVLANAFEKSNLVSKGVELVDISKLNDIKLTMPDGKTIINNIDFQVGKIIRNEAEKIPLFKQLSKIKDKNFQDGLETGFAILGKIFTKGKNAGYLSRTNKILVNSEKIGYAGFHEMGHAINKNFSTIGKAIQKMRLPMMIAAGAMPVIALLTNKRTENNPPQTKWQKTKNFIKENVGKLTTLAFVPVIAEEIMASVRGQKLAKSVLPKELMKNVTKTHIIGATSYIGTALILGVAAFTANKVRDRIAHGKQSA